MSDLKKLGKKGEKFLSKIIPHEHAKEKRARIADQKLTMQAAKEQIDYYKEAKEDLGKQRVVNEQEKQQERQKISEKQIRARKATYRRAGFLETPSMGVKDTLG